MIMKRIAIINQRYGEEVNGGSESYTRKLAEHLNGFYDVEVLTTTAMDYDTWKPFYPGGLTTVNGVKVRRFDVGKTRNMLLFKIVNRLLIHLPMFKIILEHIWVDIQGPYCPLLIQYINAVKEEFDVFIFATYLYYTTVKGLPVVAEKAILIPTAHDEYCIYFNIYRKIFKLPRGIIYLTEQEQIFVEKVFRNNEISHTIAGAGVELEEINKAQIVNFKANYGIDGIYIIYVGRIDTGKKCDQLIEFFLQYKEKQPGDLKLVLVGKTMMRLPGNKDIISVGFISENEKDVAIAGAHILIMPSEHESLSLAVLEAMSQGVPVVVNGKCEVLKAHCKLSGAGKWYCNQSEFDSCLNALLDNRETIDKMGRQGKAYIEKFFSWDQTISKYKSIIEGINDENN